MTEQKYNNGLKYWPVVLYVLTMVFSLGIFYNSVKGYANDIESLKAKKVDKEFVQLQQVKINELCHEKAEKTELQNHIKRDDERFDLLLKQNDKIMDGIVKRLDRIENKLDSK